MTTKRSALILPVLGTLSFASPARAQDWYQQLQTFLSTKIGLEADELRRIDRGEVVTKTLETEVDNEVAVFGIVHANAPVDYFVSWHKNIEHFESGGPVLAIGKISTPPRIEDFAELTIPEQDLRDLRDCRLGDCEVKVTEDMLTRLKTEVDWSSPRAADQANALVRDMALAFAEEYLQEGDARLSAYRDKKRPTFIEKELDGLLASSPYLLTYVPELSRYLRDFPHAELPRSDSFLYWSQVEFGLKPIVRLSHIVFYETDERNVAIASKMLYASHYFHTALELKYVLRDDRDPNTESFYLVSLNRSRSDGLTGLFGGLIRSRAQSGAEDGLRSGLETLKRRVERGSRAINR